MPLKMHAQNYFLMKNQDILYGNRGQKASWKATDKFV